MSVIIIVLSYYHVVYRFSCNLQCCNLGHFMSSSTLFYTYHHFVYTQLQFFIGCPRQKFFGSICMVNLSHLKLCYFYEKYSEDPIINRSKMSNQINQLYKSKLAINDKQ